MKRNIKNKLFATTTAIILCTAIAGCSSTAGTADNSTASADVIGSTVTESVSETASETTVSQTVSAVETALSSSSSIISDTADIFSERDLKQTADTSSAQTITVSDGKTIDITAEGVYIIKGTAKNCTIKVNADSKAKVQLVLDGVSITNTDFPAIYVVSADKCFITTSNSENTLSVTGTFKADGTTNTDAVIFSKDDLVLNGTGKLTVNSAQGNGITTKDDFKATGGTYIITSAKDAIEANDSVSISAGTYTITSSKDGIHCENDEDDTKGSIYISGGTFNITASSDAIQGISAAQIDGGTFNLKCSEGIEATYVQINGGTVNIDASDDGINASNKSSAYSTPTVEFNGGTTTIVMGQGDTDAVDANGDIIVNDGTVNITAQVSSFDYDGKAELNGGKVIINGEEVSEIPQSMMGGRGGFGGGMGGRGGFGGQNGEFGGGQNGMPQDGQGGFGGQMTPPDFDGNFDPNNMPEGFDPSQGGRGGKGGRMFGGQQGGQNTQQNGQTTQQNTKLTGARTGFSDLDFTALNGITNL